MHPGAILGGVMIGGLAVWWIVLKIWGIRSKASGIDGSGADPNVNPSGSDSSAGWGGHDGHGGGDGGHGGGGDGGGGF